MGYRDRIRGVSDGGNIYGNEGHNLLRGEGEAEYADANY